MEEGFSIKDALWHTLADKEHRMQHQILKLIANSRQDTSRVLKLEQRLSALEKQRRRSRSHRRPQSQEHFRPLLSNLHFLRQVRTREETEKAEERETRKGTSRIIIPPRHPLQVSGTFKHRARTGTILETSSRRTTVGSSNRVFARIRIAPASILVWDVERLSTLPLLLL